MLNIHDIAYAPKHTMEQYDSFLEQVERRIKEFRPVQHYPAIFAVQGKEWDGGPQVIHWHVNATCHRAIETNTHVERNLVWSWLGTVHPVELITPFIKWFVQESNYSRFILNRDNLDEVLRLGIFVSADMPAPLLQNMMIITRHVVEVSAISFRMFNELTERGIIPALAYSMCFNSGMSNRGHTDVDALMRMPVHTYGGHRVQGLLTVAGLINQEKGILFDNLKDLPVGFSTTYRVNPDYKGGYRIYGRNSEFPDESIISWLSIPELTQAIAASRNGGKPDMYKPPNPFTAANRRPGEIGPNDISYKELLEIVIPFLDGYIVDKLSQEMRKVA